MAEKYEAKMEKEKERRKATEKDLEEATSMVEEFKEQIRKNHNFN